MAQSTPPTGVFRADTNLQSIAVQIVDKEGNLVPGLTSNDFTLLEDGHPQKIAFFGADRQPVSLAILLDSSRSMDFSRKFDRAREILAPLIAGHLPDDQIFLMPFTGRVEGFEQLTLAGRRSPGPIRIARQGIDRGTALYDAVASGLCRLGTAPNLRQAVVVITDGADQHSRLHLEQLIELARMSTPQIFMIGLFSIRESRMFQHGDKTVKLVGEREIDNPKIVFDRLAKESGAESFLPASDQELKGAVDRIAEILRAQYTLAYYPVNVDRYRRVEVKVDRGGVRVITRRGIGASTASGAVHFEASTCEVSAKAHPYPWEPKTTVSSSGALVYREDFSDTRSGWPNQKEHVPDLPPTNRNRQIARAEYRPGLRYVSGGYEISRNPPEGPIAEAGSVGAIVTGSSIVGLGGDGDPIADGVVAAYGPTWDNMRASVSVLADWKRTAKLTPKDAPKADPRFPILAFATAPGLVFHLNEEGYYALLVNGFADFRLKKKLIQFTLIRRLYSDDGPGRYVELIPWTPLEGSSFTDPAPIDAKTDTDVKIDTHRISVEYRDGQITVTIDDRQVANVYDSRLPSGSAGLAVFGSGNAVFHDLLVQDLR